MGDASARPFRVLSIDGGGVRGIFAAHILACIDQQLEIDLTESFDMVAGTSTGSIIAAGIAVGKKPDEISELYQYRAAEIFGELKKSSWPKRYKQGFHSKYSKTNLAKLLDDEFGDTKLGDINKPLIIPATDIGNGGVHVFKSAYSPAFVRDKNVRLSEAVLASCSAPAFFNPTSVGRYLLADGGVWANNPALAAVIDAQYRLNVDPERFRVLSLGTGQSLTSYGTSSDKDWGLLRGWNGVDFVNFILSLQAQSTQNYLQLLLGEDQLIRLDFQSDSVLPLDDISALDDLISRADKLFTHKSAALRSYFYSQQGGAHGDL